VTANTSPLALPAPTHVDIQDIAARDVSDWRKGSQRVAALGKVHVSAYRLRWERVTRPTWLGVLAHYDEYGTGREGPRNFRLTPPGRDEVTVYWRDRPQAADSSGQFVSGAAVVEVAIASDRQVPAAVPGDLIAVTPGTIDDLAGGDPLEQVLADGAVPPVSVLP